MAGWTTQKELLRMEIKQREEEGCDVRGFAERFARLGADPAAVESLYDELMALPIAPDFPYEEPQTLEGIRAAVLLFAGDDYEKGITTAVLGGWDTDCNGATVGSILGAKLGAQAIPAHWTEPLHDTLYSAIPGFHPIAIRECARRSKALSDRYLLTGKGE